MTTKSKRGLKFETTWLDRDKAALPISRKYCADIARIKKASGYPAAQTKLDAARTALKEHIGAIMEADAQTMEGVVIKAQALAAWGQVEAMHQHLDLEAIKWPQQLADSILRQAA